MIHHVIYQTFCSLSSLPHHHLVTRLMCSGQTKVSLQGMDTHVPLVYSQKSTCRDVPCMWWSLLLLFEFFFALPSLLYPSIYAIIFKLVIYSMMWRLTRYTYCASDLSIVSVCTIRLISVSINVYMQYLAENPSESHLPSLARMCSSNLQLEQSCRHSGIYSWT